MKGDHKQMARKGTRYVPGYAPPDSIRGFEESLDQVRATGSLGDLPLIVVSEAPSDPAAKRFLPVWYPLQDELAHRSLRDRRVIAEGSSHRIHRDRPDVAISAIREVVVCYSPNMPSPPPGFSSSR